MTTNSYPFYRKRRVYLPDGPGVDTNDWRADSVRPLLRVFRKQYALGEPKSQTLVDLIANLMHLADRVDNSADEPTSPSAFTILDLARTCYNIEVAEQNARDRQAAVVESTAHLEYPQD